MDEIRVRPEDYTHRGFQEWVVDRYDSRGRWKSSDRYWLTKHHAILAARRLRRRLKREAEGRK